MGGSFFGLGLLSGRFVFPSHPSAVLWLPGGLSLAFLLRSPRQDWPALLAAVFLAEFTSVLMHGIGAPVGTAALWGLGNVLRTLVGAWLISRFVGTSVRLSRSWEVAGLFLFGGVASPIASATLGVLGAMLWMGPSSSVSHWVAWWLSDGLGTLLVAPLLLTWTPAAFQPKRLHRLIELGVTLAVTALAANFIFGHPEPEGIRASLAYASFPFVLWGALRLGPLGAASTSAVVATLALWHTLHHQGPFGALGAPPQQEEFSLQLFLALLGLTALTLAAVASERRRTEQLQQLLVEAGAVLAASMESRGTLPRVARLMVPRACTGFAVWLETKSGLLERVAQAGWSADREALLRGHLPPLPTTSRRWRTEDSTVVLAPLRIRGSVRGALVFMKDERAVCEGRMDLALAEDLAHRCGMALESARLFMEAQEAIEARNEFIAIAAHELRTPLTALTLRMRSLDALLQRERASHEVREKLRATFRQIVRLTQLIERLLDVGRITTGRLELHREQVDVNGLVEQLVESFAEEASRAGSELRIKGDMGLMAWWDRGRIEQALANLLANALKFGMGHPIEVLVTRQGPWVRIAVRDEGIGIAPEALERIFERFERAVSSRRYGGLGLGLFLTRQIAESHGGTIHVESTPGTGATFVLQLPVGQQPQAEQEAARPHG
ncbi:MASE1 domain-containing protein [Hyalangium sp.]|uniref:sensor histidine kinase n=1 Tax=Hyalangium sp. TaxID=2028555 RepID=UPI00389A51F0